MRSLFVFLTPSSQERWRNSIPAYLDHSITRLCCGLQSTIFSARYFLLHPIQSHCITQVPPRVIESSTRSIERRPQRSRDVKWMKVLRKEIMICLGIAIDVWLLAQCISSTWLCCYWIFLPFAFSVADGLDVARCLRLQKVVPIQFAYIKSRIRPWQSNSSFPVRYVSLWPWREICLVGCWRAQLECRGQAGTQFPVHLRSTKAG